MTERKWRKIAIVVLMLLIGEILILWRMCASAPYLPEAEYQRAEAQSEQLRKEMDSLDAYGREAQYPVEAMSALLTFKPQNVGFIKVSIGRHGNGDDAYARMTLKADSEQSLRNYLESLSVNDFFKRISIEKLEQVQGGVIAEVVVRREEM